MYQVIIVIHVLLGLCIIGLILMQQGKGADAGATFGGGASGSVFGAQGAASFLSRTTAIMATMFFITSLGLAWLNANRTGAAVDFMGTTSVENVAPDVVLPDADSSKSKDTPPVTSPESKADTVIPVSPPAAKPLEPVSPAPEATLEKIDVPKAADIKAVEEQKAEPKPELKQEQPSKAPSKKK